jgi:Protein of unknown function (DUF3108)
MKKITIILVLCVAIGSFGHAQRKPTKAVVENLPSLGFRNANNTAFKGGESVEYLIHYGAIDAATATLKVEDKGEKLNGRDVYHIVGSGRSLGTFDWFFKVKDKYETYLDKQGVFPHRFVRNCDEGGYKINQDYTFYPHKRGYKDGKGQGYMTPDFIQDMLSSFYYARTLDYSKAKNGDVFTITALVDDEIYPIKMKFLGKENITVDIGTFSCLKFAPVVQKGRIFKKEEDLTVWVTDDANHLPILARAKILIGAVEMEVTKYNGLANPISKIR